MELLEGAVDQRQSDLDSIGSPSTLPDEEAIRKRAASQEVDDWRASEEQPEQGPTSPSAQRMYPPLFAGNVEVMPADGDRWEDDMLCIAEPEFEPDSVLGEKPPEVSDEELAALGREVVKRYKLNWTSCVDWVRLRMSWRRSLMVKTSL